MAQHSKHKDSRYPAESAGVASPIAPAVATRTTTAPAPSARRAPAPSARRASVPQGPTPPGGGEAMTHRQILEVLSGLLAALFTALLSSTIVSNALPTIISDLEGNQTQYAWIITAALLATAASTPIWGKLADLFNKKLLIQASIVIFVGGSVMAGAAHSVPFLLTARVIQGIAMGGLTALVQAILGAIIPPRERGRYNGYTGATMAVAMSGGPLLGGFIVDAWGWRWTFYVCIPLAVIALIILQRTLKIPTVKRKVSIDWAGALLMVAGVSVLLIWVSFAGQAAYYDWISWESAMLVGGGVLLLVATVIVETIVKEPIIPLKIIMQRTTALSIIGSIAVGVALYGATTFLGQYFQISRGKTPTEAGLLTIPLVFGMMAASMVSGQLISRFGKWKRFLIGGAVLLVGGLALLGFIDHTTPLWLVLIYIGIVGLGTGMLMQNLVLAVQNTTALKDIGSASSSVAFFRTFGGAIGVAVLGSILASRVSTLTTDGLKKLGVPSGGGGEGGSLDLAKLPAPVQEVVRAAYGDATGRLFLIAAFVAVVTLVAVLLIREVPLRKTVELKPSDAIADGIVTGRVDEVADPVAPAFAAERPGTESAPHAPAPR